MFRYFYGHKAVLNVTERKNKNKFKYNHLSEPKRSHNHYVYRKEELNSNDSLLKIILKLLKVEY